MRLSGGAAAPLSRGARAYLWLVAAASGVALTAAGMQWLPWQAVLAPPYVLVALAQLVVLSVVAQHFPLALGESGSSTSHSRHTWPCCC